MLAPHPLSPDQGMLQPLMRETQWCAAYVIARHEKVVADQMARRSVESFLPLYHSVRSWKNRLAPLTVSQRLLRHGLRVDLTYVNDVIPSGVRQLPTCLLANFVHSGRTTGGVPQ